MELCDDKSVSGGPWGELYLCVDHFWQRCCARRLTRHTVCLMDLFIHRHVFPSLLLLPLRPERQHTSRSKRRPKCPRSLIPMPIAGASNVPPSVSCWMGKPSRPIPHPRCWSWTIKTRLIACSNKLVVEFPCKNELWISQLKSFRHASQSLQSMLSGGFSTVALWYYMFY